MKRTMVIIALLVGLTISNPAPAQVSVSVNISSQPLWGPVGYSYVEYYYLPEVEAYYWVPGHKFIYWNGFEWVFVTYLPARYHVDLYSTYKVVINQPKPYLNHRVYVAKYQKYRASPPQQVLIRDSKDPKYDVVKGHKQSNGKSGVVKQETEKRKVITRDKKPVTKKKKKDIG